MSSSQAIRTLQISLVANIENLSREIHRDQRLLYLVKMTLQKTVMIKNQTLTQKDASLKSLNLDILITQKFSSVWMNLTLTKKNKTKEGNKKILKLLTIQKIGIYLRQEPMFPRKQGLEDPQKKTCLSLTQISG